MSTLTRKIMRDYLAEIPTKKEERAITRDYAIARLWEWGTCVRTITMSGIPNANYYSTQAFAIQRSNFEFADVMHQDYTNKRWERAIQTDEILLPIRESNPVYWQAVVIRYVLRQPGGARKLPQKIQLKQFTHTTGKTKTTYYKALNRVEEYLAFAFAPDVLARLDPKQIP